MLVKLLINFKDLPCDLASIENGDFIVIYKENVFSLNQKAKMKQLFLLFEIEEKEIVNNKIKLKKGTTLKVNRIYTDNGTFICDVRYAHTLL